MQKNAFLRLLHKYVKGKTGEAEDAFLDAYDKQFAHIDPGQVPGYQANNAEDEYAVFRAYVQRRQRHAARKQALRWAACALVLLSLGMLWINYRHDLYDAFHPIAWKEMHVPPGKTGSIVLTDGSKVRLNAGSSLLYPDRFGSKGREVVLKGEGFFEVAKDSTRPFAVNTDKLHVQVLGTEFNVYAFPGEEREEVAVLSGSVAVEAIGDSSGRRITLAADEKLAYHWPTHAFEQHATNASSTLAWQQGELYFENVALIQAVKALNRKYAVHIEVDSAMARCEVYAKVGSEPLEQTLRVMAKVLKASVRRTEGGYRIVGSGCETYR